MIIKIILLLLISWFLGMTGFLAWYIHRAVWKRIASKYGWTYFPGKFSWIPFGVKDHIKGDYRGRKLRFSYRFGHQPTLDGDIDYWQTKYQITPNLPPAGHSGGYFRLDQNKLLRKAGPPIGDRYFDKKARIIKEKRKGYTAIFLSDTTIRKRVARFLANSVMDDRKISLTPTGLLKLQDSGLFQSEKRMLKALDLLSDLADIVEDPGANNLI